MWQLSILVKNLEPIPNTFSKFYCLTKNDRYVFMYEESLTVKF